MTRLKLLPVFTSAVTALAAACADPPDPLTAVSGPIATVATTGCDAIITGVSPVGTLPASRTTPVQVELAGQALPGSVKLRVTGPDGVVPTQIAFFDGTLELRPNAPWTPGTHLLEGSVCGRQVLRAFEVGAVHHALDDGALAAFSGLSLPVDLRDGTWTEPAPREGRELILRNLFAGALVLDVVKASQDELVAAVLPGIRDGDGSIVAADAPYLALPLLLDNPYALASFGALDVPVGKHTLSLNDASVIVGLTEQGLADVRISAEADLRRFGDVDGLSACELLELHTLGACVPCTSDQEPTCFALTLEGMSSIR